MHRMEKQWGSLHSYRGINSTIWGTLLILAVFVAPPPPPSAEMLTFPPTWGPTEWGPIPHLPSEDVLVHRMEKQWGSVHSCRGRNSCGFCFGLLDNTRPPSHVDAACCPLPPPPPSLTEMLTFPPTWGPTEWGPIPYLPSEDVLVHRMEKQWGSLHSYRGINSTIRGTLLIPGIQIGKLWIGVQPLLGLEGDPMRLLFERDLTPHPQYAASYKWLQQVRMSAVWGWVLLVAVSSLVGI